MKYLCSRCGMALDIPKTPPSWRFPTVNLGEGEELYLDLCPDCAPTLEVLLRTALPFLVEVE